jgi:molecular chaperone GrpE
MPEGSEPPVQDAQETGLDPRSAGEAQAASGEAPADAGSAAPESEEQQLLRELQRAQEEAASNYDKFLRARADMENYRKRMDRTLADLTRSARRDLLVRLLGVKDNLERALHYGEGAPTNGESIMEGVRLTQYQLDSLLQQEGVAAIEAEGKTFDPHLQEAVQRVNDPSVPDHTVVQVVRNGYTYGEEVLRPAQVVVSVHGDEDDV